MFSFLKGAERSSYNLLEIYSDKKGNLTAKSFYKSKEGVSQRAMLLERTLHSTSETDGATLNGNANIPQMFELSSIEGVKNDDTEDGIHYRSVEAESEERMAARAQEVADKLNTPVRIVQSEE